MVNIYQTDGLFGEIVFIGLTESPKIATALEPTRVMTWTGDEIERYILERPRLALALLQMLTKRCMEYAQRIESCAAEMNNGWRGCCFTERLSGRRGLQLTR